MIFVKHKSMELCMVVDYSVKMLDYQFWSAQTEELPYTPRKIDLLMEEYGHKFLYVVKSGKIPCDITMPRLLRLGAYEDWQVFFAIQVWLGDSRGCSHQQPTEIAIYWILYPQLSWVDSLAHSDSYITSNYKTYACRKCCRNLFCFRRKGLQTSFLFPCFFHGTSHCLVRDDCGERVCTSLTTNGYHIIERV